MKFLAIERPIPGASVEDMKAVLRDEARASWALNQQGLLREIYFTEDNDAVLILECSDRAQAEQALATLPLVQNKLIRFDVHQLRPYGGWARLFN